MASLKLPSLKAEMTSLQQDGWSAADADEDASRGSASAPSEPEDRESGEISSEEEQSEQSFKGYKPEYEWPGFSDDFLPSAGPSSSAQPSTSSFNQPPFTAPTLRLLVLSTEGHSFLKGKTVALIHPDEGCSIGRDSAPGPRLRLREMPVSKFHANLFWDTALKSWAVVDLGSMHGTFVQSGTEEPARLSPPRTASQPKALRHMDVLVIGSTTFQVHVHLDGLACEECFANEENEIPLWEEKKPRSSSIKNGAYAGTLTVEQKRTAHKQNMSSLRNSLISSLPGRSNTSKAVYVDRSAKRRRLHPQPRPSSGTSSPSAFPQTPPEPISAPPQALESSNIGHAMLKKQGWAPGMTLGTESSNALAEPIVAVGTSGRAGLGLKRRQDEAKAPEGLDWREEGRQRRFRAFDAGR